MTDDLNAPEPPIESASANGRSRTAEGAVRSGLAHRRSPALVALGAFAQGTRRAILRDRLSLFLALASIGLAIVFATLLGQIKPRSSGTQVPISTVQNLAKQHEVGSAVLLDHDSRVEVTTTPSTTSTAGATGGATSTLPSGPPQRLWAAYPSSGAQTQQLARELYVSGATVTIDQQSGKPTKAIIVQFLIPILLLVCLFSLVTS